MASPKVCIPDRGFTVLEVLMVIALLAIVGSLGLIMSMDSWRGDVFRGDRDDVVGALQRARGQAVNNMCFGAGCADGKLHGVHVEIGKCTIFQTAPDPLKTPAQLFAARDIAIDEEIKFDGGADSASPSDVIFGQLSGNLYNATSTVNITISGTGHSSTITVNPAGQIDWSN